MNKHHILIYSQGELSRLAEEVGKKFKSQVANNISEAFDRLGEGCYRVVIFDAVNSSEFDIEACKLILESDKISETTLVVFASKIKLEDKLKALEIGCDDVVESGVTIEEAEARINKSIYNQIAAGQLSSKLHQANQIAQTMLSDITNLGNNIRFLISEQECGNLDELGQTFFATIRNYGLKCSIQLRSVMAIKNMEENGMAKELESQLLMEMKDNDRFIDFGRRTIINFNKVSILIKNMPVDDEVRYGSVKDNVFVLAQGMDARVRSLENQYRAEKERETLELLSFEISNAMRSIKDSYYNVMSKIVSEVELMSETIHDRIPHLALVEQDEIYLDSVTSRCVLETNRIFNEGLKLDEIVTTLETIVSNSIAELESHNNHKSTPRDSSGADGEIVELF